MTVIYITAETMQCLLDISKIFLKKLKKWTGVKSTETSWMKLLNRCKSAGTTASCATDDN